MLRQSMHAHFTLFDQINHGVSIGLDLVVQIFDDLLGSTMEVYSEQEGFGSFFVGFVVCDGEYERGGFALTQSSSPL